MSHQRPHQTQGDKPPSCVPQCVPHAKTAESRRSRRFCNFMTYHNLYRAGDRTRTGDVQLGKLAFYQLNYARSAGSHRRVNIPLRELRRYCLRSGARTVGSATASGKAAARPSCALHAWSVAAPERYVPSLHCPVAPAGGATLRAAERAAGVATDAAGGGGAGCAIGAGTTAAATGVAAADAAKVALSGAGLPGAAGSTGVAVAARMRAGNADGRTVDGAGVV